MKDEAQYVYEELAKLKLIEPDFHQRMKKVLEAVAMFSTRDIFCLALNLSIANMIRTSASFGFDEEHLTASLAGSLASNLTWFARAYRKSEGKQPLPALRWIHQNKISEARSGIDFGLLSRVPGSDTRRPYRLLLLQAKLGNPEDMTIKIDHVTNRRAVTGTLKWSSDALAILEAAAQSNRPSGEVEGLLKNKAIGIALKKFERGKPRYQLDTLLRTDFRGQRLSNDSRPWCFYVAWHATRLPQAVDVRVVASSVWANGADRRLLPIKLPDSPGSLVALFDEALYEEKSSYGLELSIDQVGEAVDYITEVAPDIRILTNSKNPELDKIFHWKKGYTTSDTLIPKDLLDIPYLERVGPRITAHKAHSGAGYTSNPKSFGSDETAEGIADRESSGSPFKPNG